MGLTFQLRRASVQSNWMIVVALWIIATLLSALQIYFRETARGLSAPWSEVLVANALAWLPWLGIAPAALSLERRYPIPGSRTPRHVAIHISAAVVMSLAFLFYLALFHATFLEGNGSVPAPAVLYSEYAEKLGQHFLVAVMLYAAIVLGGFGHRTWSGFRTERSRAEELAARAETLRTEPGREDGNALIARSVGEIERVDPRDVDWIESWGNYARLHLGGHKVLIRRTLSSLAQDLGDAGFVRVHRSAIVNTGRVVKIRPGSHGDATLELESGQRVKVSRTHRRDLEDLVL